MVKLDSRSTLSFLPHKVFLQHKKMLVATLKQIAGSKIYKEAINLKSEIFLLSDLLS